MAITKKPQRDLKATVSTSDDKAAEAFIFGAEKPAAPAAKKRKKTPVIIRFDDEVLAQIDQKADSMGLGRAAWLRMVAARALAEDE